MSASVEDDGGEIARGATRMVTILRGAHHQCPLDQQMQLLCSALWAAMAQGFEFSSEEGAKAPPEGVGLCMCLMAGMFEAVSKRYETGKSIVLTSNKSYGQWGEIFPDPVLATALLDRLLHHATTINIRGESYRLRHRRGSGFATNNPERRPDMPPK